MSRELFTDNSTDAKRFTVDPTKTKLDVLLDKGTALAEAQIDNALRKLGTSESRIQSMTPVEKKTFLKKAISDMTTTRASLALGGINIAQNFVSEPTTVARPWPCFLRIRPRWRRWPRRSPAGKSR